MPRKRRFNPVPEGFMSPSESIRYMNLKAASFYRYIRLERLIPDDEGPQGQPIFKKETLDAFLKNKAWPGTEKETEQSQGRSLYLKKTERPTEDETHHTGAIIHWSERHRERRDPQGQTYVPVTCAKCGNKFNKPDTYLWRSLKIDRFTGRCSNCYLFSKRHSSLRKDGTITRPGGYIYRHRLSFSQEEWSIISPMSTVNRDYVSEHRAIIALSLGRPLESDEIVHHINGIKDDNRLENLSLTDISKHNNTQARLLRQIATLEQQVKKLETEIEHLRSPQRDTV